MLSKYEPRVHLATVRAHLRDFEQAVQAGSIEIDGHNLTLGDVLAVSRYCEPLPMR